MILTNSQLFHYRIEPFRFEICESSRTFCDSFETSNLLISDSSPNFDCLWIDFNRWCLLMHPLYLSCVLSGLVFSPNRFIMSPRNLAGSLFIYIIRFGPENALTPLSLWCKPFSAVGVSPPLIVSIHILNHNEKL